LSTVVPPFRLLCFSSSPPDNETTPVSGVFQLSAGAISGRPERRRARTGGTWRAKGGGLAVAQAVGDAGLIDVSRVKLNANQIASDDLDEVFAQFSGNASEDGVFAALFAGKGEFHPEHGSGENLDNAAFKFD
jgi:hypothetical protein